jgi:hypothetical protein
VSRNDDAHRKAGVVSDKAFKRNLHSMVNTYLRLRGGRRAGRPMQYYPVPYGASKRKINRSA